MMHTKFSSNQAYTEKGKKLTEVGLCIRPVNKNANNDK